MRERRAYRQGEASRGAQVARVIRLAIKLAQYGQRACELPDYKLHSNNKTSKSFYRDLRTLEAAGIPVYVDDERRYRVDAHFMRRFL